MQVEGGKAYRGPQEAELLACLSAGNSVRSVSNPLGDNGHMAGERRARSRALRRPLHNEKGMNSPGAEEKSGALRASTNCQSATTHWSGASRASEGKRRRGRSIATRAFGQSRMAAVLPAPARMIVSRRRRFRGLRGGGTLNSARGWRTRQRDGCASGARSGFRVNPSELNTAVSPFIDVLLSIGFPGRTLLIKYGACVTSDAQIPDCCAARRCEP